MERDELGCRVDRPVYDTIHSNDRAYIFCLKHYHLDRTPRMKGICLTKDDVVQAAVCYDWFNGQNCFMHVCALPGSRWMTRDFLKWAFNYPFLQNGLLRVSGWVEADNSAARRLNEHLGFTHEATLKGAGQSGVDVMIYAMKREDCRYV